MGLNLLFVYQFAVVFCVEISHFFIEQLNPGCFFHVKKKPKVQHKKSDNVLDVGCFITNFKDNLFDFEPFYNSFGLFHTLNKCF